MYFLPAGLSSDGTILERGGRAGTTPLGSQALQSCTVSSADKAGGIPDSFGSWP